MKTNINTTEIYNLIILDESGSMGWLAPQTISGCNETLKTIRESQKEFAQSQTHYVSIYVFQSGSTPSRYLVKNAHIDGVKDITDNDYSPCGGTPLFDAIGSTVTDLKSKIKKSPNAIANVTIITDGAENSSQHYTAQKVSTMIDALKELGWSFNFIGANIDVKQYSDMLHIDNCMQFVQDEEGTREMFERERRARHAYNGRISHCFMELKNSPREEMANLYKSAAADYFEAADEIGEE